MSIISPTNLEIFIDDFTSSLSAGSIEWATVAAMPTNSSGNRTWNFKLSGILTPAPDGKYTLRYDFTKVPSELIIGFSGNAQGFWRLKKGVFSFFVSPENWEAQTDPALPRYIIFRNIEAPCTIQRPTPTLLDFYLRDDTPTLTFDYMTSASLSTQISGGECNTSSYWCNSQTYYANSYANDASGNPIYTGYLQFNCNSTPCTPPVSILLNISSIPSEETYTALLGIYFNKTVGNPTSWSITWGQITYPVNLPNITSSFYYGFMLSFSSSSSSWQVISLESSPIYIIPTNLNYGTTTFDSSGNELWSSSYTTAQYKVVTPSTQVVQLNDAYISFPTSFITNNDQFVLNDFGENSTVYIANTGLVPPVYNGAFTLKSSQGNYFYYCVSGSVGEWQDSPCPS